MRRYIGIGLMMGSQLTHVPMPIECAWIRASTRCEWVELFGSTDVDAPVMLTPNMSRESSRSKSRRAATGFFVRICTWHPASLRSLMTSRVGDVSTSLGYGSQEKHRWTVLPSRPPRKIWRSRAWTRPLR